MGGTAKFLVLIAAGCLAGVLLWPAPKAHVPGPAPHAAAIVPAPISGARIWYAAKNMPLLSLPDGRQEIVRSVLNITGPMQFGSFAWNEDRIPEGPLWVRIDLTRQLMSVFRAGHEIGTAVILYGTDGKPTPTGSFSILEKDAHHYSHSYDAPMPYMLRLTNDGVAIHGSNVREGYATHGCIGVPPDFARLLFAAAKKGDLVVILPVPPGAGKA